MRAPRTLLTLILIALAVGAERFAYYGSRAFLSLDFHQAGQTYERIALAFTTITWASIAGMVIGGAIAYATGPRIVGAIGAGISALALVFLALTNSPAAGFTLLGFGSGVFRFTPWAAAGHALATERDVNGIPFPSGRRFVAMAAFASSIYVMSNISAMIASPILGAIRNMGGRGISYGIAAVVALIAAALVGASELVVRGDEAPAQANGPQAPNDPYRGASQAKPIDSSPMATIASTGLAGLAILAIGEAFMSLGTTFVGMPPLSVSSREMTWLFSINPIVVILVNITLAIVFLVGASNRSRSVPLFLFACGTLVTGFGFLIAAAAQETGALVYALAQVVIGVGEVAFPIGLAYAALSMRGRGLSLALAMFSATTSIVSASISPMNRAIAGNAGRIGLMVVAGLGAIVCGVIFLVKARRIHAYFLEPAELQAQAAQPQPPPQQQAY